MMHTIEHEFDELFHDLERSTRHGVEHHDLHYTTIHGSEQAHQQHPRDERDFHASPYRHEYHREETPYEHDYRHPVEQHHTDLKKQTSVDDKKTQQPEMKQPSKKNYSEDGHHYDAAVHDFVQQILSTSAFVQ